MRLDSVLQTPDRDNPFGYPVIATNTGLSGGSFKRLIAITPLDTDLSLLQRENSFDKSSSEKFSFH